MEAADPGHWMILGDIFFVYSLVSNYITFEKKQYYVGRIVELGGLDQPSYENELWEAQKAGFTRTSQRYHSKYGQFWLLVMFAERMKELDKPEAVLSDPRGLQDTLDSLLEEIELPVDRAHDMRHAILYMTFPDDYERIISTDDKEKIVRFYRNRLEGPAPDDLDDAVRRVRAALADEYDGEEPFDFYDDLKKEWRAGTPVVSGRGVDGGETGEQIPDEVTYLLSTLSSSRNVILQGPPGTGKTYLAKAAAEALVAAQADDHSSESVVLMETIENLSFYDVLALCMYRMGRGSSHPVSAILDHELVQARHSVSPVQNTRANVWGTLQSHADPDSRTVNTSRRAAPYLFDKEGEGSRWYLTHAGREYVEEELAAPLASLDGGSTRANTASERFVEWTTFHQSFAYEDFVEGLRPVLSEEDPEGISYRVVPGVFRRICARAAADPDKPYVLVIDEINRGNIAKILGELMTLLEDDKRAGEPNGLAVTLPYSGDTFSVPKNLYVIGTMNTADRSIALLDVALRRRFAFVEVMPNPALLGDEQVKHEGIVVPLGELLRVLSRGIVRGVDRDHQIGHSYLLDVAKADGEERLETLEFVWNNQIVPLLGEYFYAQREKLAELLAPFLADEEAGGEGDDAAFELSRLTGDSLIFALHELVSTEDAQG
jgi:DNA polymerase III delta prime subunit